MKTLLLGLSLAALFGLGTGCATPGHSGGFPTIVFPSTQDRGEHANLYLRGFDFETKQLIEDLDTVLLLDPQSRMTRWNVR